MAGKCLRLLLLVGQTMRERKKMPKKNIYLMPMIEVNFYLVPAIFNKHDTNKILWETLWTNFVFVFFFIEKLRSHWIKWNYVGFSIEKRASHHQTRVKETELNLDSLFQGWICVVVAVVRVHVNETANIGIAKNFK